MVGPGEGGRHEPIVVTGLGLATSLGFGVAINWERLQAGDSAIEAHPPEQFVPPIELPTRLGAAVDREELAERIRRAVPRSVWNTAPEVCHIWLLAALEAAQGAGLGTGEATIGGSVAGTDPARVGIFAGTGGGPVRFIEREFDNIYAGGRAVRGDVSRMGVPKYMASSLAAQLSLATGFRGPAFSLNAACASGSMALLAARDALLLGRIDCALAGGADMALGGTVLKGFANLGALSTRDDLGPRASRPFDAERDGFVLGEGAACLVLETRAHARARGAEVLAELRGGAAASEAHSLLSQQPDGEEVERCIALALEDARIAPADVGHVQAHGTGTPYNDRCEAKALTRLFPHRPSVSASKALLGHTIGAAAAIDAVLAVRTLETGSPVPARHVTSQDAECDLNLAEAGRPWRGGHVLVNAFAFGGHNAALLFAPPADNGASLHPGQGAGN